MPKLYLLDSVLLQVEDELDKTAKIIISFKQQLVATSQHFLLMAQSLLVWKNAQSSDCWLHYSERVALCPVLPAQATFLL